MAGLLVAVACLKRSISTCKLLNEYIEHDFSSQEGLEFYKTHALAKLTLRLANLRLLLLKTAELFRDEDDCKITHEMLVKKC